MTALTICMLGGTGFVGHRLAAHLCEAGHRVTILTRRRARHGDLLVLPTVVLCEGDVYNPVFLQRAFEGADAVINLVGILNERGRSGAGFKRAHVELPMLVVEACYKASVTRLLHMGALNAAPDAPSQYLRSKAAGEDAVFEATAGELRVTSFRPSVIFGPGDGFTNRFARLLKIAPGVFPLACPQARFQPVYVDDVARAFVDALTAQRTFGNRYDLCGPRIYTLREIVVYLARLLQRPTHIVNLSDRLSRMQAAILEFVPGKPFSLDNYRSLTRDSVCNGGIGALRDVFDIEPTPLERVVPAYLGR